MATKKKPNHKIWFGAVRPKISANVSSNSELWYSVTISRRYKDDEGNCQELHAYSMRHLSDLAQTVEVANQWVEQHADTPEMRAIVHGLVHSISETIPSSARRAS